MKRPCDEGGRFAGKTAIAARLRLIREEIFGEDGGPELAERLDLPLQTWLNYERGVTIPGEVLLRFLVATGTDPIWLFSGEGSKYQASPHSAPDGKRKMFLYKS